MKSPVSLRVRILRLRECLELVGVSRSSWFDINNPASPRHDASCPRRVKIGIRSVGWFEHELLDWLESKRT